MLAFNGEGGVEVVDVDREEETQKDEEQQLKDKERRDRIVRQNLYRHGLAGLGRGTEGEKVTAEKKDKRRGSSFDDFLTSEGRLRDVSPSRPRSEAFEIVKEKDLPLLLESAKFPALLDTANSTAMPRASSSAVEGGSVYHRHPVPSKKEEDSMSRSPTLSASTLAPVSASVSAAALAAALASPQTNAEDVLFPSTLSILNSTTPRIVPSSNRGLARETGGDVTPTSSSSPATLSPISPISHSHEDLFNLNLHLQDQASLERSISEWEEGFMSSSAASASVSVDDGEMVSRTVSHAAAAAAASPMDKFEYEGETRGQGQDSNPSTNRVEEGREAVLE